MMPSRDLHADFLHLAVDLLLYMFFAVLLLRGLAEERASQSLSTHTSLVFCSYQDLNVCMCMY